MSRSRDLLIAYANIHEGHILSLTSAIGHRLRLTSCSVSSVAQEDENALTPGSPDGASSSYNLGQAHFIVKFDQHRSVLTVRLVKALNLSPLEKEWSKPCNPYVIVQLLPDYRHQLQSTVHKKTTNPRFDETFEFEVKNF